MMVMQYINHGNKISGKTDVALPLPFIESTMAVLGLSSLFFNAVFLIIVIIFFALKKIKQIPAWVVIFNFIILALQFYWFIIDKR
jgi:hypothetical protein